MPYPYSPGEWWKAGAADLRTVGASEPKDLDVPGHIDPILAQLRDEHRANGVDARKEGGGPLLRRSSRILLNDLGDLFRK